MSASPVSSPIPLSATGSESPNAETVALALRNTEYLQLQDLNVRVDGDAVILRGRLSSYYLKQLAYQAVLAVPGIHTILDAIDVVC